MADAQPGRQPKRRPQETAYVPNLPERMCPEHSCLMEPVVAVGSRAWYYCPTGGAVRVAQPEGA